MAFRPQEDLPSIGGLLQPRRHVHGVAAHETLSCARIAGDDLSGVDAGAPLHRYTAFALQLVADSRQPRPDLYGGAHGTESVVLVHGRHTEYRHDRVTDVFLDCAAVALDDGSYLVEVARHDTAQ